MSVIIQGLQDKITDTFTRVKNDFPQLLLVSLFSIFMTIILCIVFYNFVKEPLLENSRCVYKRGSLKKQMKYVVAKELDTNDKLFKVVYDLKNRSSEVRCSCMPGVTANSFKDIQVKDLKRNRDMKIDKQCLCDTHYRNPNINWYGSPDLVRYMYNKKDDEAFDSAYQE